MTPLGARPPKIARKDTTIFFNRYYFIKKFTHSTQKKSILRRKMG